MDYAQKTVRPPVGTRDVFIYYKTKVRICIYNLFSRSNLTARITQFVFVYLPLVTLFYLVFD